MGECIEYEMDKTLDISKMAILNGDLDFDMEKVGEQYEKKFSFTLDDEKSACNHK